MLPTIRIVLVNPSHPGNIGAVARAMKTMCLEQLYLVRPKIYPSAEATSLASGADDLLARAIQCPSLVDALQGCALVIGTSARSRSLRWPEVDPRACAYLVSSASKDTDVAIVFGPERTGLSNLDLEQCQYMLNIPANPKYSSLNLAAAVQIVGYELLMASRFSIGDQSGDQEPSSVDPPARYEEMQLFYQHMREALIDIEFLDPQKPRRLMRRLHRYFNRSQPSHSELNILRGILTAAQRKRASNDN
jgi:TrmH family RNA methyltransferase